MMLAHFICFIAVKYPSILSMHKKQLEHFEVEQLHLSSVLWRKVDPMKK